MKINCNNEEKLKVELAKVEARAKIRKCNIYSFNDYLMQIESRIRELKILRKNLVGMKFKICTEAQDFPNAYKFIPMATIVTVEWFKSGWFVTDIQRKPCMRNKYEFVNEKDFRQYFNF